MFRACITQGVKGVRTLHNAHVQADSVIINLGIKHLNKETFL